MSINFVPPRILRTHWDAVAAGAQRVGRGADRSSWRIARDVYVADTNAEARREALAGPLARDYRDYFLRLLAKIRGLEMIKVDPAMPDSDVTLPYLLDNIWIVGDPDTVAAKLAKLRDEVGGFGALLVIAHEWRPQAAWERSMVLLREQVLPRLARRDRDGGRLRRAGATRTKPHRSAAGRHRCAAGSAVRPHPDLHVPARRQGRDGPRCQSSRCRGRARGFPRAVRRGQPGRERSHPGALRRTGGAIARVRPAHRGLRGRRDARHQGRRRAHDGPRGPGGDGPGQGPPALALRLRIRRLGPRPARG